MKTRSFIATSALGLMVGLSSVSAQARLFFADTGFRDSRTPITPRYGVGFYNTGRPGFFYAPSYRVASPYAFANPYAYANPYLVNPYLANPYAFSNPYAANLYAAHMNQRLARLAATSGGKASTNPYAYVGHDEQIDPLLAEELDPVIDPVTQRSIHRRRPELQKVTATEPDRGFTDPATGFTITRRRPEVK